MSDHTIEPDIAEAVHAVANRYGVAGLEDLIDLAQQELVVARKALEELAPGPD
ncbi:MULTISPECIES: hypothetical protein [unclassified Nocardioides]|uniref:hypothetical protein n=1 Tax=unclassified Nocardioides TaxID=2615069 RepID=UPI0009F06FF5|nr:MULTISPECIES: hypothetical protein [unclassified Nocardioides]GAW51360.1 uncharacterized protein PD653B2_3702 [Nocardioides sp. PD653-B2]GAW52707.1 uncharacterized protein PD653_0100 [Nocardioides sp. PD653]